MPGTVILVAIGTPGLNEMVLFSIVLFFVGIWIGSRIGRKSEKEIPERIEVEGEEEEHEDPTAPIAPMIEVARSPHDRHRDLAIGKSLVEKIDFLESMIKAAVRKGDGESKGQLEILLKEFRVLLKECAVESFEFSAGTVIDSEVRNRIKVVGGEAKGERSVVAETLQCGYLYLHGDEDTMIIRKAEIRIG